MSMKGETVRFQRFETLYEIVSWMLTLGLIILTYASPAVTDERRPILYLIATLFGFSAFLLVRLMPIEYAGWVKYEKEDKVLTESLVMILLLTAFLYMTVLPFTNMIFLFLLPILIEASILHERVIFAEAAFAGVAIIFLKLADTGYTRLVSTSFISDLLIFFSTIALMYYLTRQLRTTTEENDRMSVHLSERLDQIQVITQIIHQSEFFSDIDKLLERIGEITSDAFDAEQCGFFTLDPDRKLVLHPSSVGFKGQDRKVFSLNENIERIQEIFEKREQVVFNQSSSEEEGFGNLIGARHLKNFMIIPIRVHEVKFGMIMVANKRKGDFENSDINFLRLLGGFISTLVDSANSFQKVSSERHAAERMTRLLVGRELRMKELKEELKKKGRL